LYTLSLHDALPIYGSDPHCLELRKYWSDRITPEANRARSTAGAAGNPSDLARASAPQAGPFALNFFLHLPFSRFPDFAGSKTFPQALALGRETSSMA